MQTSLRDIPRKLDRIIQQIRSGSISEEPGAVVTHAGICEGVAR
jgi:hypothetical protein